MSAKKRILFIANEMSPYLELTEFSEIVNKLAIKSNDSGFEVRCIMPRFGTINERRHRLHEVVRLYGLHRWAIRSHRHVAQELGWEDVMVRSPLAMRRHWELVCCAVVFCRQAWLAQQAIADGETPSDGCQGEPIASLTRRALEAMTPKATPGKM